MGKRLADCFIVSKKLIVGSSLSLICCNKRSISFLLSCLFVRSNLKRFESALCDVFGTESFLFKFGNAEEEDDENVFVTLN